MNEDSFLQGTIGVVIPSYNQAEFLESAICSVIACQKHADIKICIMDGGSQDGSISIIQKYEKYLTYWQSQKDGGQAEAINAGVNHLKDCEYVTWLNSDDEYDNEWALANILSYAEKHGAPLCYGKSYYLDKVGKKTGEYAVRKAVDFESLYYGCWLSQPSVIVKTKVWNEFGGLNKHLYMCLDYDLWIRIASRYTFVFYDGYVGNTRLYDETKTSKFQQRNEDESLYLLYKHYGRIRGRLLRAQMYQDVQFKVFRTPFIGKMLCYVYRLMNTRNLEEKYYQQVIKRVFCEEAYEDKLDE